MNVRHIEHKLGIHGSPTCELTYKNAKAELCGSTRLGLIKYVMALMNGARLGIAAQSVGVEQEAYNEGLAYAKERQQFGDKIINFPAVYDMLSRMKAKLDAGRSLLYETAAYVDIYKCLEDIERDRKLTPEEKQELKKYQRLADAFTPLAKGMNSEYANQNAYDAISIHGGSGFIMEYKSQRLFRDARIFSIYEGTTQLQVVAAIRYITNGTMLNNIKDMLAGLEVSDSLKNLKARVEKLIPVYEEALNNVKALENQDAQDFLARRLYDMTAELVMSLLILRDATKAPELFEKSANVYVRMTEEDVFGKSAYIKAFQVEDLDIDIIARDGNIVVFVEVKTRKNSVFGAPEEAIDFHKLQNLQQAINHYVKYKHIRQPIRFDIVSIVGTIGNTPDIRHIQDVTLI